MRAQSRMGQIHVRGKEESSQKNHPEAGEKGPEGKYEQWCQHAAEREVKEVFNQKDAGLVQF